MVGSPLGPPDLQRMRRGGLEVFGGQQRVWVWGLEDTTLSWSWLWRWFDLLGFGGRAVFTVQKVSEAVLQRSRGVWVCPATHTSCPEH